MYLQIHIVHLIKHIASPYKFMTWLLYSQFKNKVNHYIDLYN